MIIKSDPESFGQSQQSFIPRTQLAGTTNFAASEEMRIVNLKPLPISRWIIKKKGSLWIT